MFCENCGTKIVPGSRFCENCGAPISDTEAVSEVQETFEEVEETPVREQRTWQEKPAPQRVVSAPRKESAPARKSSGKIVGIIAAVAAVIMISVIYSNYREEKRYEEYRKEQRAQWEKLQAEKAAAESAGSPAAEETGDGKSQINAEEDGKEYEAIISEETYEENQETEDFPSPETVSENEVATDEHGYYLPSEIASFCSVEEPSEMEDFAWFLDDVLLNGVPESAEPIREAADIIGAWKCLVIDDPQNKEGKLAYHLGTMDVTCRLNEGRDFVGQSIYWDKLIDENGTKTDESGNNPFLSVGYWSDDGWYGKGGEGNMSLKFWTISGVQYAWGSANFQNVEDNIIVLVRP